MSDYGQCQATWLEDCGCDAACHEPATHERNGWRWCKKHRTGDAVELTPAVVRRSEMWATLQALEKAWSRTPEKTLADLFAEVGIYRHTDSELLKALEKYGGPK